MPEWLSEVGIFLRSVAWWWVKTVGGAFIAVLQICYAIKNRDWPPAMSFWLLGICFMLAVFMAWREQYKAAQAASKTKDEIAKRNYIGAKLTSYLLDIEDRIMQLRGMEATQIIMFGMTPGDSIKDDKRIDEIFGYLKDNISLSVAGNFLSNTGLEQDQWKMLKPHEKHIENLNNRAIRLKRIIDDYVGFNNPIISSNSQT